MLTDQTQLSGMNICTKYILDEFSSPDGLLDNINAHKEYGK
jgi:hypothetical protein